MDKYSFFLDWGEGKSVEFLEAEASNLRSGFALEMNKLGEKFGGFGVEVQGLDGRIVMLWSVPSSANQTAFRAMMNQGVKELQKRLGCKCYWEKTK